MNVVANLRFKVLYCNNPTDQLIPLHSVDDEVYFIVVRRKYGKEDWIKDLPPGESVIEMNNDDDSPKHVLNDFALAAVGLENNETVDILVTVMDSDSSPRLHYVQYGNAIKKNSVLWTDVDSGAVVGILNQVYGNIDENMDDNIGAFVIRIINGNGHLNVEWKGILNTTISNIAKHGPRSAEITMIGNGSNYWGVLEVWN